MKKAGLKIMYKDYGSFDAYASAINRQVLWRVYLWSLLFECLYYAFVSLYKGIEAIQGLIFNLSYIKVQPIIIGLYLGIILVMFYYHEKYSGPVTLIAMSFIFFHKLMLFIYNYEGVSALVIWVFYTLIFTWLFLTPWVFLPVVGFSFTYLIYGLLHQYVDITTFSPYLWMMMASVIVASFVNIRSFRREQINFADQHRLIQENKTHERQLNFDAMTRLYTKYAMDQFVDDLDRSQAVNKVFVVVMDLDELSYCNQQFGHQKGDDYIRTFGKIIKFLEKTEGDQVARVSGDNFMAVVTSYTSRESLETQLARYNQLLKEEFHKRYMDDLFSPNVSYGIAEYKPSEAFDEAYAAAEQEMQQVKRENKKHLSLTNYYLPNINYNTLFETGSIVAIVWLVTQGWPVAYVSENIKDFLGYSNEVLLSGEIIYKDLIHKDDQKRVNKEVEAYLQERTPHYEQTYRLRRAQGDIIWVRDHSVPIWEDGLLVQINGTLYDITDTKRAEEEVREKSVWLNDIIEATNVGTWEWDIREDVIRCNDRFATMIGYTVNELSPIHLSTWRDLLLEEDRTSFDENMKEHLEGRKPYYELECRVRHKNGSLVWVYDRGRIMKKTDKGDPWMMIGSKSDITELKQTETMLYHSEKLNALGRLSGGIAHDMNNQLMMISSMSEISEKQASYEIYKKNNRLIGQVVDKSRSLMHQLLSFTKHRAFNPLPMDLVATVQETVNILRHTFDETMEIRTIMAIKEGLIEGDRSVLDNVFINLCINAKEAMSDGGQLIITVDEFIATKRFHTFTGYLQEGGYIEVRFSDNGVGIEQESLKKVFEPFYSTKEGGTGIGLSTVVSAVRAHKGGMNVRSEIGLGTVFTMYLPMLKVGREVDPKKSTLVPPIDQKGRALKVMVVDDEPVICQVLSDYLSMQGFEVIHFVDPVEALDYGLGHKTSIDCLVLDILMPVMSGLDLFHALRELNPQLPALFLSGYSEGIQIGEEDKDQIIDFLEKPAKLEEIYHAIQRWFYPEDVDEFT